MSYLDVLKRFKEKRELRKFKAAGVSEDTYRKYKESKAKRLLRYEQSQQRQREERIIKEKYARPSFGEMLKARATAINKQRTARLSSASRRRTTRGSKRRTLYAGKTVSSGPNLGLVRDPLIRTTANPWLTDSKKKDNPWLK